MIPWRSATAAWLVLLSASLASPIAFAQPADAPATDTGPSALALAREGVQFYEAGRWAEAEAKFVAAEAITHSPVFLLYIARAQRSAGKLLAARASLKRVASEVLAADAPAPWKQSLVDARAELAALEPTIPSVVIDAPALGPGATATIDGAAAKLGEPVEVDPGNRTIVVRSASREERAIVDVRAGERARRVAIGAATAEVVPPGGEAGPDRPDRGAPATPSSSGGSWVPGAVVLGLGGVGLAIGGVTGILALGASSDATEGCTDGQCPTDSKTQVESDLASAGTLADVSTVSFIAGGVLATAGVVLLVVRPFGREEPAQVTVGPRSVSFVSAF